jgi:hypothetical protein
MKQTRQAVNAIKQFYDLYVYDKNGQEEEEKNQKQ